MTNIPGIGQCYFDESSDMQQALEDAGGQVMDDAEDMLCNALSEVGCHALPECCGLVRSQFNCPKCVPHRHMHGLTVAALCLAAAGIVRGRGGVDRQCFGIFHIRGPKRVRHLRAQHR